MAEKLREAEHAKSGHQIFQRGHVRDSRKVFQEISVGSASDRLNYDA